MFKWFAAVVALGAAPAALAQDPCALVYLDAEGEPRPTLDVAEPLGGLHLSDPALVGDGDADQATVTLTDGAGVARVDVGETGDSGVFDVAIADLCTVAAGRLTCGSVVASAGAILTVDATTFDCDRTDCASQSASCRIDLDVVDSTIQTDPMRIKVPRDFPTIQAAVDVAPDGARIKIAAGTYDEVLIISGDRQLTLVGTGAYATGLRRSTTLVGPVPERVPELTQATALLTVDRGASVKVRGIRFDGGDTGIHIRDSAKDADIFEVFVENAARGIVTESSGRVRIRSSHVENTAWHGVVVKGQAPVDYLELSGLHITGSAGVGIYLNQVGGTCSEQGKHLVTSNLLLGNALAGIYVLDSGACIFGNGVLANGQMGIGVLTTANGPRSVAWLANNHVTGTTAGAGPGDAEFFWESDVLVDADTLSNSARAGIGNFGAYVEVSNTTMTCNPLDLAAGPVGPNPHEFLNVGGNACGCPIADGSCVLISGNPEPPPPVTPP